MKAYEGMFLLDNRQANRDWDRTVEQVKAMLAKHGAQLVWCQKWAERKLAYEIRHHRRATYLLSYFRADKECPKHIYREVELSELVLRALILAVEKIPPEPKPEPAPKAEPPAKSAEGKPAKAEAAESEGAADQKTQGEAAAPAEEDKDAAKAEPAGEAEKAEPEAEPAQDSPEST